MKDLKPTEESPLVFRQESGSSEAEREGKKVLEVMPCPALGRGGSGSGEEKLGGPPFHL